MRFYLRTFGCRANQYDSEAVRALLEANGHHAVDDPTQADAAIFNSCAVTTAAEADLRQAVRHAARRNPALRTTIMGCASARPESQSALGALPTVEHLIAGADMTSLGSALDLPTPVGVLTRAQTGTRGLLRIQDGCDEHCTFCATTLARGANRSRHPDELIDEASELARRHSEIVLTGVHIGSYGTDIDLSLGELVERLVAAVPSTRFRLSSIEATEVDDRIVALLAAAPLQLAPSLHAPLQSGSDRVLRRMGRHWYTASSYARRIDALASRLPAFGLGADVIAGFPGETDDDHRATVALVEALPFTYLHVFPYSVRPGTAAERLRDRLPPPVVAERAAELRAVGVRKAAAYRQARDGGEGDVILLSTVNSQGREGVTGDYLEVRVDDPTLGRGARFQARLSLRGNELIASPLV
jgi:threonylcarbamoyladenosine tRNA methylthiotransferase MtaB